MEKITLYKIAVGCLIVLNLILVAFLWFGRPKAQHPPFRASEQFEMDEAQNKLFRNSVDLHKEGMNRINREQRLLLAEYFNQLKEPASTSLPPLPKKVLELEEQKILATYRHFYEVKNMLTTEQLNEYPDFVDYVINRVIRKEERKPRR